jgi:3-deoxy-manno-octulosonate cytidylyltransferase (CMP-KDO synthetase)
MSKAVGIIPARWSSTRFPGKPLHPVGGKPLLKHVWERCLLAKNLDLVVVATDDMRIASAAFDWGAEVALTSPKHRSGTNRAAEVARKTRQFAYVINIQGDEPLIAPRLIDKLVEKLRSDRNVEIVTAAHPFENPADAVSPHQVKVVLDLRGNALYFSRAPIPFHPSPSGHLQIPNPSLGEGGSAEKATARSRRHTCLFRHQGIYGFRRQTLLQFVRCKPTPLERIESLEQLRALENGIKVHVLITAAGSPGIDTPEDATALDEKLTRANRRMAS